MSISTSKRKPLTYEEFMALAKANYTKGGDSYFECWDEKMFSEMTADRPIYKTTAFKMFREEHQMQKEYEAARRWYAGEGV